MSSLRKYFVPPVLPKKRVTLLILAMMLSSAIMGASIALLLGISNSTSDFLTPADNVVIISNPRATTPFTSSVPLAMIETIKQIDGVLAVSPEILLVGTTGKYSVIGRGVIAHNFTMFNSITMLKGRLPQSNDSVGVALGTRLAQLLGLDVGDTFNFVSALKNFDYDFKVVGIYSSGNYLDDEFIISLVSAIPLSNVGPTSVSHIQVKLDTNVISSKEFKKMVFSIYNLKLSFHPLNGTNNEDNVKVTIREKNGGVITYKVVMANESISFNLVFGTYNVSVELVKNPEDSFTAFTVKLKQNMSYSMGVGIYSREVTFSFVAGGKELTSGNVSFYNEKDSKLIFTDDLPLEKIALPEGKYLIKYSNEEYTLWGHARVKGVSPNISVNLQRIISQPTILTPLPNVNYSTTKIPLVIIGGPDKLFYQVDNSSVQEYLGPTTLDLGNGIHNLTVYYNDSLFSEYVKLTSISFGINASLPIVMFDSGIVIGTTVLITTNKSTSINIKGKITLPLKKYSIFLENIPLRNDTDTLSFDSGVHRFSTGIYRLDISGTYYNGTNYRSTFYIQISSKPFFIQGLNGDSSFLTVLPGIELHAYLPKNIIRDVLLNKTPANWSDTGIKIPTNVSGDLLVELLLQNGSYVYLGSFRVANKTEFYPQVSVYNKKSSASLSEVPISDLPATVIFKSSFYSYTEWYVSLDNSSWHRFGGVMIIDSLNTSLLKIYIKYRVLWGFSPVFEVNITNSVSSPENRALLFSYSSEGLVLKSFFSDNLSLSVKPFHYVSPLNVTFNSSRTSFLIHALFSENVDFVFDTGILTVNFYNITGFNPFISETQLSNYSYYGVDTSFSVNAPSFLSSGLYFQAFATGKLSLVRVLDSCFAHAVGPLFVPTNYSQFVLTGSYAAIYPLTSTDASIVISIINGTVYVGNLTTITTVEFGVFSQANTSQPLKVTITPFSNNVSLSLSIFERVSDLPVKANVTIIYKDDGTVLEFLQVSFINASLRKGDIVIKVYYEDYFTSTSLSLLENKSLSIKVGQSVVEINVVDPNNWKNVTGYYLSIKRLGYPDIIKLIYVSSVSSSVFLEPGTYVFESQWLTRTGSAVLTVSNKHYLSIFLDPLLTNITIKIEGTNYLPRDARILHLASRTVFYPTKMNNNSLTIVFENVYRGGLSIVLQGEDYTQNFRLEANGPSYNLVVTVSKSNTLVDASDLLKLANSLDYSLTDSDQYLNSFISGPLELIKTVFFAEVILVIIVIMANVISVMRGIISESRNEIFVLKSMGANQVQVFIGTMRQSLFWGFFASIFGTIVGVLISFGLVEINSIRIFSHSFVPFFSTPLLIYNSITTIILYSLGFFFAYKEELANEA